VRIGNHDTHELADTLPLMDAGALAGLIEDIKANGQRRPIVIVNDPTTPFACQILDGRNRYLACVKLKIEPRLKVYDGPDGIDDLARYVISENLARRDLTDDQRAIIARRLDKIVSKASKRPRNQPALTGVDMVTRDELVSLEEDGIQEVRDAAVNGVVSLDTAYEISKLEPEQQEKALARIKEIQAKPVEVKRAKVEPVEMRSVVIELSAIDVAALRALSFVGDKSTHAEVRAGAALLRRMAPVVGR